MTSYRSHALVAAKFDGREAMRKLTVRNARMVEKYEQYRYDECPGRIPPDIIFFHQMGEAYQCRSTRSWGTLLFSPNDDLPVRTYQLAASVERGSFVLWDRTKARCTPQAVMRRVAAITECPPSLSELDGMAMWVDVNLSRIESREIFPTRLGGGYGHKLAMDFLPRAADHVRELVEEGHAAIGLERDWENTTTAEGHEVAQFRIELGQKLLENRNIEKLGLWAAIGSATWDQLHSVAGLAHMRRPAQTRETEATMNLLLKRQSKRGDRAKKADSGAGEEYEQTPF